MTHILFLPGAAGAASFWHPLGNLLPRDWRKTYLNWPGLGHEPHLPGLDNFDALLAYAAGHLEQRSVVVAQSMGGVFAMQLALQFPERVSHLVLTATSGGIRIDDFDMADWRRAYRAEYPLAADWITTEKPDCTSEIGSIAQPVLLLWGNADPISPVAVGRHLAGLLPASKLHVVADGDHSFARDRAAEIAPLVAAHSVPD